MNGWHAFRAGLSRALRYPWVWIVLFVVNLASALLLAALPAAGLTAWLGHRPAIRQAADGTDAWLAIEGLLASFADTALGQTAGVSEFARKAIYFALVNLAAWLLLPLLAWLPAAFLTGGVLLTYTEGPIPFRLRCFLWGCWHWFGAFLLLSLVQGLTFVVFLTAGIVVVALSASLAGWLAWAVLALLILFALIGLVLFEYTRVVAVVEGTRNVARAFGSAVRFCFRRPLAVAGLYGLALLTLALLHVLFRAGLFPRLPLTWWPLVLVVQQAFVLARLWARLARMAGAVALYGTIGGMLPLTAPANHDKLSPILERPASSDVLKGGGEPDVIYRTSSETEDE